MTTLTCKLPDDLAAQLDAAAREQRRTKSEILREALVQRLGGEHKPVVSAFDLVKHLSGSIQGGPSDVATNPKYMSGFGR